MDNAIVAKNLVKNYKGFSLTIPELVVPKGKTVALIGENGAGKTTLVNILTGIRLDYTGEITYFDQYTDKDRENGLVKERIGYTGPGNYYLPTWTLGQVKELNQLIFKSFHADRFDKWLTDLAVFPGQSLNMKKKISEFSDGTKMKVMLANAMARDTDLLIMDEPASPLDPLMRDTLNTMIRRYVDEGNGEKTAFYSTHNVSDMESITDYAIIMERGAIVEAGDVEELKAKYNADSLYQASVEVMKRFSAINIG